MTWGRWLEIGVMLAGGNPREMSLEDATDICEMLVATGRLLPPSQCVSALIERQIQQNMDSMLDRFASALGV